MEDKITIPAEEKKLIKDQILMGIRQKYLRFKAEYLASIATSKLSETASWEAQMNEAVLAHDRVEADL